MTPERAMMYSRLMMGVISPQNIVLHKDGSWYEPAITDLLRQAVNDALEEAAIKALNTVAVKPFHTTRINPSTMKIQSLSRQEIADAIRALKISEE